MRAATAAVALFAVVSAEAAEPIRPVLTLGGGYGGVFEKLYCDDACGPGARAEGPAALLAGGVETGTRLIALRAELQLLPVVGHGGWAVAGGPMFTLRLAFIEYGGGMMLAHVRRENDSLTSGGLALRIGLAAPVSAVWTIHGAFDFTVGSDVLVVMLGVAVSRKL
jgi:hypothetical protein